MSRSFDIEPIARHLLGKPNAKMSKLTELRFGARGSMVVDLEKNTWFSHEEHVGGGVLDLIRKETGITNRAGQLVWLEQNGFKEKKSAPSTKNEISKPEIETIYKYTDEKGQTLFEVIRYDPKGFKQRKPNGKGGWDWSVKGVRQVPFHLPQLINSAQDDLVFILEGEKDVLRLESLGLLATCNAGGAGKWPDELATYFNSRRVVILPDNDIPGNSHARLVAQKLKGVASSIRILCLPNLAQKGDVSDWLDAGGSVERLLSLVTLPGNDLPQAETKDSIAPLFVVDDEDDEKQSQGSLLVKYVEQRFELFHNLNKDGFAKDLKTGEVRSLASRQFRDHLQAGFYSDTGKAPREQSIREALSTLVGLGRFRGKCLDVHLRTAGSAGEYFLDLAVLGSSQVVHLRPGSWEIVGSTKAMFLRPESMRPLPEPVSGGSIDPLWRVANIPPGSRLLVLAWLIECLRPDTPYPVVELLGEQGSAKSTTQTALRRLIDPNACNLRGAPKTAEDIFVSAGACGLVSYENVSHLSAPMQDALCVLATGGGFAKRKLYSDAEESIISVKRPIILNGIAACVTAQDLIDRTITIETPVIHERLEVTDLWQEYEAEHPRVLGALLDLAVKALMLLPQISLPADERPRLVEFARLGMAVAEAVGEKPENFLREFNASRQESLARTLDSSPVASAIVDLIEARPLGMAAPAKVILLELEQYRPAGCESWPRSAKGLGDALRRAAPALRQLNIECKSLGKIGGSGMWEIKRKLPKQCLESPEILKNDPNTAEQQDIRTLGH
ncbi:hypothetical protein JQR88_06140 [Pseudomonas luteola]|uniref:toprim domain-containing protein n=1 Tax=Pseudomonas luteola TaxID=47886 RepID=UPI003DA11568